MTLFNTRHPKWSQHVLLYKGGKKQDFVSYVNIQSLGYTWTLTHFWTNTQLIGREHVQTESVLWSDGSVCGSVFQDTTAVWNGIVLIVPFVFATFRLSSRLWRYYFHSISFDLIRTALAVKTGDFRYFISTHTAQSATGFSMRPYFSRLLFS